MDGERAVWFDSKESILAKVPFRRGGRPRRSDLLSLFLVSTSDELLLNMFMTRSLHSLLSNKALKTRP